MRKAIEADCCPSVILPEPPTICQCHLCIKRLGCLRKALASSYFCCLVGGVGPLVGRYRHHQQRSTTPDLASCHLGCAPQARRRHHRCRPSASQPKPACESRFRSIPVVVPPLWYSTPALSS